MSEFDAKARDWDKNQRYVLRTQAVSQALLEMIPLKPEMKALEYGSGTALLSFELKDRFSEITLMDNSKEMTQVTIEKIAEHQIKNMKPLCIDLELQDFDGHFDIIYSQMVMHHVLDVDAMLAKFYIMLNPGGYLVIADLYAEDGTFHSSGFSGHHGFDVADLGGKLSLLGFDKVQHSQCYVVTKTQENGNVNDFPLFLLAGFKR